MALKKTSITTAGLKELQARMKRLEVAVEPKDLKPILLTAVSIIGDRAHQNYLALGLKVKTGNLLKAFRSAVSKSDKVASAWTKAGNKVDANHAHLIEYGHDIWTGGQKRHGRGHSTGKTARAFPFFRPAVDAMRAPARKVINEGIVKLLWDSEK